MSAKLQLDWRLVTAIALMVFLGAAKRSLTQEDTGPVAASALVSSWQGRYLLEGQEIRVEVEISENAGGDLTGRVDFRDAAVVDVPVRIEVSGRSITMSAGFRPLFEVQIRDDLRVMEGRMFVATMGAWKDLVLEKDNPAFRRFALPRLTDSGEAEREYVYRPPEQTEDGWPVSALSAEGIDEEPVEALVERVLRGEPGRPEAILIARNGKLVLEEYFYGFRRDRLHPIQSVTKSVTSLLFGIARDGGLVGDLGQPIYELFPDYKGRRWIDEEYPITLFHLLTMSAGVEWSDEDHGATTAMYRSGDWIGYVLDLEQTGQPGEAAAYNSGLPILLGDIVRRATDKYVVEFAEETLFADLEVSRHRWRAAPDGTQNTGGGLILTAYDLAKMGQIVLGKGMWNGKRVVSESWIEESTKKHLPFGEESVRATGGSRYSTGYGYQWWYQSYEVEGTTVNAVAGLGYGGQYLGIFPTLDTVIVLYNGEWGDPAERVFDSNAIVEEWILPAIRRGRVGDAGAQEPSEPLFLPAIGNPAYAAGEGPVVLVDGGHFNAHLVEGSDRAFAEFLRRDGYRVRPTRSAFTGDLLSTAEILVIPIPLHERNQVRGYPSRIAEETDWSLPHPSAFSPEEIMAVRDWVQAGGSLLLVSDHSPAAGAVADLAMAFGICFSDGHARDCRLDRGESHCGSLDRGPFRRSDGSLVDHPITNGRAATEKVDAIPTFGGSAFRADTNAVELEPLLVFRPGAISLEPTVPHVFTPETSRVPIEGWFQGAALRIGEGRAVFFGEAGMFFAVLNSLSKCPNGHECPDATWAAIAEQNPQFLLNALHWLSGLLDGP